MTPTEGLALMTGLGCCIGIIVTVTIRRQAERERFDRDVLKRILTHLDRARERPIAADQRDMDFERLGRAVDAIAVEVERVAEGQRFVVKLLADRAADERLPIGSRQPERVITPH